MIEEILAQAGLNYRRARFPKPPAGTYAVYTDDVTAGGADRMNLIYTHNATVELYEPEPDETAEVALEQALNDAGLQWEKQDRYWIQEPQRYQVIYEFTFYEKRRAENG